MPLHSYDDFLRAFGQESFGPAYYFFGPEDILKDEAARALIGRVLDPGARDFNLDQCSAAQLDPEGLHTALNTLPMLSDRRVVLIRDVEQWKRKPAARKVLLTYLANPSQSTVVILVQGSQDTDADPELTRGCHAVSFESLAPERVVRWIEHRGKGQGVGFGPGAAKHLAAAAEYQLGPICSELEKLAALGSSVVSVDQVADLVGLRHGETAGDLVAAAMSGETAKAARLLGPVLDLAGMSGVKLLTQLGTALVGVALARSHLERGSRGSALQRVVFNSIRAARPFGLGSWTDTAAQWSRWAADWPLARLHHGLAAALKADRALKETRISDERGVLLDLILELGGMEDHGGKRTSARMSTTSGAGAPASTGG